MKKYFPTAMAAAVVAFSMNTVGASSNTNIAIGKPVSSSSIERRPLKPEMAVDGNPATRWSSEFSDHNWITVDLQERHELTEIRLFWEISYPEYYDIKTSDDGVVWRTVKSVQGSDGGQDKIVLSGGTVGRFVRIEGYRRATRWGHSLWELEIYGRPVADNISHYKPVSASSYESNTLAPEHAVDGDPKTRWSSLFTDHEWLEVDLGAEHQVNRVKLHWEHAYSKDYELQTSYDGENWTVIRRVRNSDGGLDEHAIQGHGRYLRVKGSRKATGWGHSLWELEVFGYATSDAKDNDSKDRNSRDKTEQGNGSGDAVNKNQRGANTQTPDTQAHNETGEQRERGRNKVKHSQGPLVPFSVVTGPILLEWEVPTRRENGDHLGLNEVAGYEIRYKKKGHKEPKVIIVENYFATFYPFERLNGLYQFSIAVFDTNGLYSKFVDIKPTED